MSKWVKCNVLFGKDSARDSTYVSRVGRHLKLLVMLVPW